MCYNLVIKFSIKGFVIANKIKPIPSKARELLEAVVSEFGIEVIKDYIKIYDKQQRRRRTKHNTKEEVAYDVYDLMFNKGYDKTRAKETIALKRHLSKNTINNHLYNFDKEAKKNNFYTLGWIVDRIYEYHQGNFGLYEDIDTLSTINDLERDILFTYYWKYKTLPKREKSKYKVDLNSIKIPSIFKETLLKEYYPQETTLNQNSNNNFSSNNNIQLDEDDIPF